MKPADSVTASVDVAVDPDTAFRIFTEEIDSWWERGPINFYNAGRAVAKRFERGVGGRYLEIYDEEGGDVLEIGRITVWEVGRRLVWRHSLNDTEVDIRFEGTESGTRVTLEQRLIPGGAKREFNSGWRHILAWFAHFADSPSDQGTRAVTDIPRIIPVLLYKDTAAAGYWLIRVFGLRPRHHRHPTSFDELMVGESMVVLSKSETSTPGVQLYVYVDDLEEHLARATAEGAKIIEPIRRNGVPRYVAEDIEGHRWTFAQARPTQR
ncbi:MAG TPA: SRPBCC domain-containing protein [Blastocatellia bacterium]|nr:SRPBCC domain-containing protein [Blastocatellia bacterium]